MVLTHFLSNPIFNFTIGDSLITNRCNLTWTLHNWWQYNTSILFTIVVSPGWTFEIWLGFCKNNYTSIIAFTHLYFRVLQHASIEISCICCMPIGPPCIDLHNCWNTNCCPSFYGCEHLLVIQASFSHLMFLLDEHLEFDLVIAQMITLLALPLHICTFWYCNMHPLKSTASTVCLLALLTLFYTTA